MSACGKLYTFLWRRLYLQTIRRHYLALLMEIIFVLVTFIFFLQTDRVDLAKVKKLNSSFTENVQRHRVDIRKLKFTKIYVVYGPSNDRTDKLINKLLEITDTGPDGANPASHDDPHKVPVPIGGSGKPIPLEDASAVAAKCRKAITILLEAHDYAAALQRIICIEFAADSAHDSQTGGLTYSLVLPVLPSLAFPREVVRSVHKIFEKPMALFGDDVTTVIREGKTSCGIGEKVHVVMPAPVVPDTQRASEEPMATISLLVDPPEQLPQIAQQSSAHDHLPPSEKVLPDKRNIVAASLLHPPVDVPSIPKTSSLDLPLKAPGVPEGPPPELLDDTERLAEAPQQKEPVPLWRRARRTEQ
ncbi:hypothetical protein HPB52_023805 [Rhipicephalus sanguineus]|uniref:Uncharacterized protein n=1 Tax=Rhipicephalus sanguineus TaxID=34632 RepID=A0A9D4SV24_RHISA|nr:hypothetical protein HPB52_023805 [Rhipicephalus sanguineus]